MDYKQLGFKCGIEIHQQVETHKLFSHFPSLVHDTNPTIEVKRKLRAVAGEGGLVDQAAAYQVAQDKTMIYQACDTSAGLVELDEEPPGPLNEYALETALQVAQLLNAKIVDEIRVMRKTVVDGSNTSGFQRTMLIALDGYVETSKGKVMIESICLEEESAKKVEATKEQVHYRLDRLGVPLIEIATDASIKDAEHCKEVAGIIGMVLRSTNRVKRGIGTIRQDVNVSIKGHPRVEIKGFQDLRSVPAIIEFEVKRQLSEMKRKEKPTSHVRKAEANLTTSFLRPMPGAARMYPETDVQPIEVTKKLLSEIELPELLTEKARRFEDKYCLSPELAREVMDHEDFAHFVKKFKSLEAPFIARALIEMPKEVHKRYKVSVEKIKAHHYENIFDALANNKINESAVLEILADLAQGHPLDLKKYKKVSTTHIEEEIKAFIKQQPNASPNAIMGMVMKKHRGAVDGKTAMELIKKYLS